MIENIFRDERDIFLAIGEPALFQLESQRPHSWMSLSLRYTTIAPIGLAS